MARTPDKEENLPKAGAQPHAATSPHSGQRPASNHDSPVHTSAKAEPPSPKTLTTSEPVPSQKEVAAQLQGASPTKPSASEASPTVSAPKHYTSPPEPGPPPTVPTATDDIISLLSDPNKAAAMLQQLKEAEQAANRAREALTADKEDLAQQRLAFGKEKEDLKKSYSEASKLKAEAQASLDQQSLRAADLDSRLALAEAREKDLQKKQEEVNTKELAAAEKQRIADAKAVESDTLRTQLETKLKQLRNIIEE